MTPDPPGTIRAAGAVLWRPGPDGRPLVALIHRPRYDDWSFPKGKVDRGEHVVRAAAREVWEETGVWPVLGRRLSTIRYEARGRPKRVDYWTATGDEGRFVPNDEVDRVDWLPIGAAEGRLSYDHDRDVLREFAAGPLRTTPYIVLRHATAGQKRDWEEDDLLRPLDQEGRAQAQRLDDVLICYGPARVISSATARCLETVLPYAARTAADVRTDWAVTVGTAKAPGDRLAELLADGVPAVICTHGELVPELIARACEELGASPPEDPRLPKGGFWVVQVADRALASLERHTC
ncbi:NUDIX hydrolase [Actinoallomurus rhizosphaericola]|uniref:NUDIX hydrolase n=1 Tax=Actinoallomurus rhizosphaericola TaxID=2952536 RepID=UPI002092232B|nr:NUDIX domain-containing protein [Actinoallomurus rhizosphaericola]MCO6000271.1 NUDIX hydrolase [Actinoallomurus rhizosphaericola]